MLEHLGLVSALTELSSVVRAASPASRSSASSTPRCRSSRRSRARRLPHRAGEPDERRPPRAARAASRSRSSPATDSVVLRVADDGRGFAGAPDEHGGLRSMRERALLVGGALAIKQAPEGGVEVRLEVPAAPVAARAGGAR